MITLIEYKDLPDAIPLTKGRRPVYYTKKSKIPKKYSKLGFDKKGRLLNEEGELIIKNARFVNQPRTVRLNFNLFWSGVIHRSVRSKIKTELTNFFSSEGLKNKKIEEFPVVIHFEATGSSISDIDNGSFLYIKAFFDTLTKLKVIPDDTREYIAGYSWIHKFSDTENKLKIEYAPTN